MRRLVLLVAVGCGAQNSLGYLQPPQSGEQRLSLGALDRELAHAMESRYRAPTAMVPISLTPADGSELVLKRLGANITIDGPIAHTELWFTFHNTEDRRREGRFSITMPPGAAVTKFSMMIEGMFRDAKIVSREKGREVYERILHRRRDPALLEQDLGNQFSARIFPIEANEDKELILAYDVAVAPSRGYTLALAGLPRVGELATSIDDGGKQTVTDDFNVVPQDVRIAVPHGDAAIANDDAFVARVDAHVDGPDVLLDDVLYLVDTSASRAPLMGKQLDVLKALVAAQARNGNLAIAVFDQSPFEIYRGRAEAARFDAILEHGALGASNLGAALERATTSGMKRAVIIGDGAATAGEADAAKLSAIVRGSSLERVDFVQVGQSLDRTVAQRIVHAGRTRGTIADGNDPATAVRQLQTVLPESKPIRVDGATAVWPDSTRDVAPGEPVFVYGLRSASGPLVVHVGDKAFTVEPRKGDARRAVARAELADLIDRRAPDAEIEKLAMAHELISPRTSLIVLESDGDMDAPPADSLGVTFSGSSSLENQYYVDGVNTTGLSFGSVGGEIETGVGGEELCILSEPVPDNMLGATRPRVKTDVQSPLALDLAAASMRQNAFAFTQMPYYPESYHWEPHYAKPYAGPFLDVMNAIAKHDRRALEMATAWHLQAPGDVASILALGEALEAQGASNLAARAYGSIADLYPARAEMVRAAGERIDRIADAAPSARAIAVDFYRRALRERPDHVTTYRLLAYALLRANRADEALDVILEGANHTLWPGMQHILTEDAGIIGAAIVARTPSRRYEIAQRLPNGFAGAPSLRVVLSWETDATDVDLHVTDSHDEEIYKAQTLKSGGRLLEDIADGYGPEAFVVDRPKAFPYKLAAHYYNKGAMGIGLGTVQIIRHDGNGGVIVEDRPFVVQTDDALVPLGSVSR